jgi:hypothetical protein
MLLPAHGNGGLNARTMSAAIARRLAAASGQKIGGPVPQPVVILSRGTRPIRGSIHSLPAAGLSAKK